MVSAESNIAIRGKRCQIQVRAVTAGVCDREDGVETPAEVYVLAAGDVSGWAWKTRVARTSLKGERHAFLESELWNRRPVTATRCPLVVAMVLAASLGSIAAVRPGESKNPAAAPTRALSQGFRDAVKAVQPAVVMIKSEAGRARQVGRKDAR